MKTRLAILFCLTLTLASLAQEPATAPPAPDDSRLVADQLEQLLGPIALYPDALIALMLPAATAPADVVLAARYLNDGGDPNAVASRAWDESVKSLVHYVAVVKWMDNNLAWTKQVGEAFLAQPAEVMQAIQRLRARARAAGTLRDSPQQQVIADGEVIMIVPAQTDVLYVPYYDAATVYAPPPAFYDSTPFMTFSPAFAVGPWLVFDCDWRHRTVWKDDHDRARPDHHDWRHPVFPGQPGYVNDPNRHPWRPPTSFPGVPKVSNYRPDDIARPAPLSSPTRPAMAHNNTPNPRVDSPDQPPRNDGRNRDSISNRPLATTPASTAAATTTPTTVAAPPPDRRANPGQARNDIGDRPNRPIAFPNPPIARPAINNPAPVAQASPPPISFPIAQPQASRVVPAFTGPAVAPLPPPPPPAAAPAPAVPPAQPTSDKGGGRDSDQKKQAY
jgi:hypothetical protein